MFLPTPGRSMRESIPREASSVAFPIPDNKRIWVVPTTPADRMTSFDAETSWTGPGPGPRRVVKW
jgi:hypothetical protein